MLFLEDGLFSRERLAGYDSEVLKKGVVTLIGAGAAGNNIALPLALSGLGEIRIVDDDHVEPSNLTRSPLFRRDRLVGATKRYKAKEVAMGALGFSFADTPIVRYAVARIEALGLGALAGSGVVISAVDSFAAREYLSDATRLLRIPLVEVGFSGSQGHVTEFPNRSADDPCWRCLHPSAGVGPNGISCTTYARAVAEQGRTPATQPLAAVFGALAAETAVQVLHGNFPLRNKLVQLDIRTGRSDVIDISPDADCPGAHRCLEEIERLPVSADEPLRRVFEVLAGRFGDLAVELPHPFLVEAPCELCGARVTVMKPAWAVRSVPKCRHCPEKPPSGPARLAVVTSIASDSRLAHAKCRKLGLPQGTIFEVRERGVSDRHVFQLVGSADDLFTSVKRKERNGAGSERIERRESDGPATGQSNSINTTA